MKTQKRIDLYPEDLDVHVEHEDEVDLTPADSTMREQVDVNEATRPLSRNMETIKTKASAMADKSLSVDANGDRNKGKASVNSKPKKKVQFVLELPV